MVAKFSIKELEKLSGIKAHTLRIWEQRYGILKPTRTDTNIRCYCNMNLVHTYCLHRCSTSHMRTQNNWACIWDKSYIHFQRHLYTFSRHRDLQRFGIRGPT